MIIVNFNGGHDLLLCLGALDTQFPIHEVLVVDNASVDGSIEVAAERFPHATILRSEENLGFAGGANLGARHAVGDVLIFLNPDTIVGPGCIDRLAAELMFHPGVAGPLIITDGLEQCERGATIDLMGLPRGLTEDRPPLYVHGCCLATSRECFDSVGGFDERYFLFAEDVEYSWQALRHGYEVRVVEEAAARHRGGAVAIGGYLRDGHIETTSMRILLRERNTAAMLLACAPVLWLPVLLLTSLARTAAFAALLVVNGRSRDAGRLLTGLSWNVRQIRATMRRRWRQGTTAEGVQRAWRRVAFRLFLWDLARSGLEVRFVDSTRNSSPELGNGTNVVSTTRQATRYRLDLRKGGTQATLLGLVPPGTTVLDLGCASGYLGEQLRHRGCEVYGIDIDRSAVAAAPPGTYAALAIVDLNEFDTWPFDGQRFDVVIAADVLEHVISPEEVLGRLPELLTPGGRLLVSLPNIAHGSIRLSLLAGHFDYGEAGILDRTHLHLYTFKSAQSLLEDSGWRVVQIYCGSALAGRLLNRSTIAAHFLKGLLSTGIIVVAKPLA